MASAVDSVPLGVLSFSLPFSVCPSRSSRKIDTTRAISLSAGAISGSSRPVPISCTRLTTMAVSSSRLAGRAPARNTTLPLWM